MRSIRLIDVFTVAAAATLMVLTAIAAIFYIDLGGDKKPEIADIAPQQQTSDSDETAHRSTLALTPPSPNVVSESIESSPFAVVDNAIDSQSDDPSAETRNSSPSSSASSSSAATFRQSDPGPKPTSAAINDQSALSPPAWLSLEDTLVDETRHVIAGRVKTVHDDPIADIRIQISPADQPGSTSYTVSDRYGNFRVNGLRYGEYRLSTEHHPLFVGQTARVRAGNQSVRLKLAFLDVVAVRGTVTDEAGEPLGNVQILPPQRDERLLSDENGEFDALFSAPADGAIPLLFKREGYLSHHERLRASDAVSAEPLELSITLRQGSFPVSGYVLDQYGSPIHPALVQLKSASADVHLPIQTDSYGRFEFSGVQSANDYEIKVGAAEIYSKFHLTDVSLYEGVAELDIRLKNTHYQNLNARVIDIDGNAVEALSLLVTNEKSSGRPALVTTDSSGEFSLDRLVAGELQLRSRTSPGIEISQLTLDEESTDPVDLVVDMGTQSLFGFIDNPVGTPLVDANLEMRHVYDANPRYQSTTKRSGVSSATGEFRFMHLSTGVREVVISAEGYQSQTLELDPLQYPGPHLITLKPIPQ